MAIVCPFRPLRYNATKIGDLSTVVAPPYDVISKSHQDALHERSEWNVVRLILNRAADPYGTAGNLLRTWRRNGVLVREPDPALCYYVEDFTLPDGSPRRREGIIGTVRLEPFHSGVIRPHERTFALPKEDRMRVLRACRTNLSPIFGLYADHEEVLAAARTAAAARPPDAHTRDDAGVEHRLWLLTNTAVITGITAALAAEPILIADGHHRYETALTYAQERRAATDEPAAPYNFVMTYLTSMSHPGLVILPTHRVFQRLASCTDGELLERLRQHFQLTAFPRSARSEFQAALRATAREGSFGIALARNEQRFVAVLQDAGAIDKYAAHLAPVLRRLDVTLLDTVVLKGLLGIDCAAATQNGSLAYIHDDELTLRAVADGAQVAFIMNPSRIEDVQAVCAAGETMPQKSTYFFPKLLTGLVFNPLEDERLDGHAAAAL